MGSSTCIHIRTRTSICTNEGLGSPFPERRNDRRTAGVGTSGCDTGEFERKRRKRAAPCENQETELWMSGWTSGHGIFEGERTMRIASAPIPLILLLVVLVSGCGRKETYTTPEGTVTLERQGDTTEVTVESEDGTLKMKGDESKMTVTTEKGTAVVEMSPEISEDDIGIPIYPGAKVEQTVKRTDAEEEQEFAQVHLSTADSFEKVKTFYQEKLPKATVAGNVETPDVKMLQMMWKVEGEQKMIMVSRDKSNAVTRIVLHRMVEE